PAAEQPIPAAEAVPSVADRRALPARCGKPERCPRAVGAGKVHIGHSVGLAPAAAGTKSHRGTGRVELDLVESGDVDDDAALREREAARVMPATADGDRKPVLTGEAHRLDHVVDVGAAA